MALTICRTRYVVNTFSSEFTQRLKGQTGRFISATRAPPTFIPSLSLLLISVSSLLPSLSFFLLAVIPLIQLKGPGAR